MYLWIAIIIILIQFFVIWFLVINNVVKNRTVYQSIISIWKVWLYTKNDEDTLRWFQEALKMTIKYLDSRVRAVVTEQSSESKVNGKEVFKPIETIYTERGQLKQLAAIRQYMESLVVKQKGQ